MGGGLLRIKRCKYSNLFLKIMYIPPNIDKFMHKMHYFAISCLRFSKSFKFLKSLRNTMPIP